MCFPFHFLLTIPGTYLLSLALLYIYYPLRAMSSGFREVLFHDADEDCCKTSRYGDFATHLPDQLGRAIPQGPYSIETFWLEKRLETPFLF